MFEGRRFFGWVSASGRASALVIEASDGFPSGRASLRPDTSGFAPMGFLLPPEDASIRCPSELPSLCFAAGIARLVRRPWSVLPASTATRER